MDQQAESFTIEGVLGSGGSAIVYAARDGEDEIALKVLRPEIAATEADTRRFLAEARHLAELRHPSVIGVRRAGTLPDGRPFIAMERLRGETLAARIERGALPRALALKVFSALASGVSALHDAGLLHRDIKPENVFLREGSEAPVLLDLGIARETSAAPSTTTAAGIVRGTPATMAPERFFGAPASEASEVYELALLLYAMLAGTLPWGDATDADARLHAKPLNEVDRSISGALADAVMSALSTRIERRPASVRELARRVESAAGEPTNERQTADLPTRAADSPLRTADVPVRTTEPPMRSDDSPMRTSDVPVRTTEPPMRTANVPVRTTEPPGADEAPLAGQRAAPEELEAASLLANAGPTEAVPQRPAEPAAKAPSRARSAAFGAILALVLAFGAQAAWNRIHSVSSAPQPTAADLLSTGAPAITAAPALATTLPENATTASSSSGAATDSASSTATDSASSTATDSASASASATSSAPLDGASAGPAGSASAAPRSGGASSGKALSAAPGTTASASAADPLAACRSIVALYCNPSVHTEADCAVRKATLEGAEKADAAKKAFEGRLCAAGLPRVQAEVKAKLDRAAGRPSMILGTVTDAELDSKFPGCAHYRLQICSREGRESPMCQNIVKYMDQAARGSAAEQKSLRGLCSIDAQQERDSKEASSKAAKKKP